MSKIVKCTNIRSDEKTSPVYAVQIDVDNGIDEPTQYFRQATVRKGNTILTISCPWGTQAMANYLLAKYDGFQYQPFEAEGCLIDYDDELGDTVSIEGVYSGIYEIIVEGGVLYNATLKAPTSNL